MDRFGDGLLGGAFARLTKLMRTTTVSAYYEQFRELLSQAGPLPSRW